MKQVLTLLAFFAFGAFAQAQDTTPAATTPASKAVMTFKVTTIDYGNIEKGADPLRKFEFTNTGTEPLIIKNAKGSCGCTVPKWPTEPIMPGETSNIEVRYDTQRVGPFTKTVTLTTNEAVDTKMLTIKGEVKAAPETPSVPNSNGGLAPAAGGGH